MKHLSKGIIMEIKLIKELTSLKFEQPCFGIVTRLDIIEVSQPKCVHTPWKGVMNCVFASISIAFFPKAIIAYKHEKDLENSN